MGGQPLIGYALAEAARAGFELAVVVISPAKKQLRDYLIGTTPPLPVEIALQDQPLGIGDAVVRCWQGEPLGVLLPDDVVLQAQHWTNLLEVHRHSGAAALCVRSVPSETTSRFGIAECDGDRVIRLIEKPVPGATASNLAIFGRYVVTAAVIAGLGDRRADGELELTYGFSAAIPTPPVVRAIRFNGRTFDCGTPAEYAASIANFTD